MPKKVARKVVKRRNPTPKQRDLIRQKTGGLCHSCGGRLGPRWQADHVKPVALGGDSGPDNFLPACRTCNRLKWHRKPVGIREILRLGIYARNEIYRGTDVGQKLKAIYHSRAKRKLLPKRKKR